MPRLVLGCAAALVLAACYSVGRPFPARPVHDLRIGRTTQEEIRQTFGPPWRTGQEDGQRTWTYGHYRYPLLGPVRARDLVVRFDDRGVLRSYTYNTTERE